MVANAWLNGRFNAVLAVVGGSTVFENELNLKL
jgi:hypothetical protein